MAANAKPQNLIDVDDRSPMDTLPYWARATNPIVRRHLGLYWRTLPPEFEPIFYTSGFWVLALLAGIVFPFVTDLATTVIVVSVLVIPVGIIFYLRALFSIAANSAAAMADEIRNNTMQLLMSTPMSLEQIFLGKVASAIWRKDGRPHPHRAGRRHLWSAADYHALRRFVSAAGVRSLNLYPDHHHVDHRAAAPGAGAADVRHGRRRHWRLRALPRHRRHLVGGLGRLLFRVDQYAAASELAVSSRRRWMARAKPPNWRRRRRICVWLWRWR